MRVIFAASVAVLSITAAVLLAPSSTSDGGVRRFVSESRHTAPLGLDGLNEAARAEMDRRTFLTAALVAEKARLDAEAAALREAQQRAARAVSRPVRTSVDWDGGPCAYADLIRSVWTQDAEWAISIAWRESRCQPGAANPSGAHGLFQMLGHHDIFMAIGCPDEFDPGCNVRAAWSLYQGSGRAPWSL